MQSTHPCFAGSANVLLRGYCATLWKDRAGREGIFGWGVLRGKWAAGRGCTRRAASPAVVKRAERAYPEADPNESPAVMKRAEHVYPEADPNESPAVRREQNVSIQKLIPMKALL